MPKEYFCKQLKDLEICGENNPDKFEIGRYSTCRECRKNFVKDYNKGIREEERKKKEVEIIDKISIDSKNENLGKHIQELVIDIIHRYPLFEGKTILEKIEKREFIMSDIMDSMQNKYNKSQEELKNIRETLLKENDLLKNENETLRNEIILIKNILQKSKIYDFEKY